MRLRLAIVLTVIGACLPLLTASSGRAASRPRSLRSQVARVATVDLSQRDKYSEIAVVDARILLFGSTSQSNDPEVANTCYSASVDPSSLVLSDERSGSCADPALEGRQVLPVFAIDKNLPASTGGPTAVVRIAHVVRHSPGYKLGPVVMTFPALAWGGSEPTWTYGGGDLWLYEWDNPGGIDLVRISATTGTVLQRLRVPKIWHAILAYNDEGLWIAPSGQTGSPDVLYLVPPGDVQASALFHFPDDGFAKWIIGSGDDLWLNAQPRPVSAVGVVWMLRGPQAKPAWQVAENPGLVQVFETLGGSGMAGDAADGLWAAPPTAYNTQQVVRIDPTSGTSITEAAWRTGYKGSGKYLDMSPLASWTGVTLAGSFFLLDPPFQCQCGTHTGGRFSALYRVTPSH
jgi:hypothetical protein